jgi:hypothetical protein
MGGNEVSNYYQKCNNFANIDQIFAPFGISDIKYHNVKNFYPDAWNHYYPA